MKKQMVGVMVALMVVLGFTGCKLNEGQVKTIAQSSGTAAAVIWIAAENPDRITMTLVSDLMDVIQTNLVAITSDKTYTEVLYPVVVKFARSPSVPEQYEPLVLAGGLATLQSIDVFFVMYPSWKEKAETTQQIVNCFILGAKTGFSLSDTDQRLINARNISVSTARAKSFQK